MSESNNEIEVEVQALQEPVIAFFDNYSVEFEKAEAKNPHGYHNVADWKNSMSEELRTQGEELISRLLLLGQKVVLACKNSLLVNDADVGEVPTLIRKMIGAIKLNTYIYRPPRPIYHEEGFVIGSQPAENELNGVSSIAEAKWIYLDAHERLMWICRLASASDSSQLSKSEHADMVNRYRPNSAFIMMWMDKDQPELVDVRDVVRDTFDKFGIHAVRADDIEHEGIITQRVLDEIRTSEFLFADLTGARPSVYYEVGYAHALPKRVILFRKKGTSLHFDLAGYNCPEYENLHDLKEKLSRRLESVTNKKTSSP